MSLSCPLRHPVPTCLSCQERACTDSHSKAMKVRIFCTIQHLNASQLPHSGLPGNQPSMSALGVLPWGQCTDLADSLTMGFLLLPSSCNHNPYVTLGLRQIGRQLRMHAELGTMKRLRLLGLLSAGKTCTSPFPPRGAPPSLSFRAMRAGMPGGVCASHGQLVQPH